MKKLDLVLLVSMAMGLTACGGGGSGSSSNSSSTTSSTPSTITGQNVSVTTGGSTSTTTTTSSATTPTSTSNPSTGTSSSTTTSTSGSSTTTASAAPTTSSATDCFDQLAATAGTKYESTMIITEDGKAHPPQTDTMVNLGTTTYNGKTAYRYSHGAYDDYYEVDMVNKRMNLLADVSGSTETYTPGQLMRYDLNAGDSYTQTYNDNNTFPATTTTAATTITNDTITEKTTYIGQEQITVQAGTFTACKFVIEGNAASADGSDGASRYSYTTTQWYSKGSGVLLKDVEVSFIPQYNLTSTLASELTSAKINGVPIQ